MPKLKTKSSAKKRFKVTASGLIKAGSAKMRHMMRNKSQEMKRSARGTMILADCDARIVRKYMPYL